MQILANLAMQILANSTNQTKPRVLYGVLDVLKYFGSHVMLLCGDCIFHLVTCMTVMYSVGDETIIISSYCSYN